MLVSLKWLNEYVKVDDLDPQELANKITLHSVEVESVQKVSNATGIVVGYVEKKEQHPDADKLSVCQVNLGEEAVQIVCGADNVDVGQKVPVATNGAVLPGGFKIKKTKLRGQISNGMICSATELGIASSAIPEEVSGGIWILPEDAPVGEEGIAYLGFDDWIIELGLTPNRMDMLSMYGVANDVAAILNRKLEPIIKTDELTAGNSEFSIAIETKKCSAYLGKVVAGVKVESSDFALQMQLMATGNKPINNIVDLTNKIMLQTGLPIHAFDADKLPTKEIIVKEASGGETVVTLDGQERKLAAGDILITSGDQIIAIAGIMGTASSAVDKNTKNILFEGAIFDPTQIRKTAGRLNLRTNASARFEKGIHVERIFEASALIDKVFENAVNVKVGNFEAEKIEINITYSDVNSKLGTDFFLKDLGEIFDRLNLEYSSLNDQGYKYTVKPSTRMIDVRCTHDLIEEVARINGYSNIPAKLPTYMKTIGGMSVVQKAIRNLHKVARSAGLQNVVTYSLTHEDKLGRFLAYKEMKEQRVSLLMPLSLDHAHLRKSLIPGLLDVVCYNKARQIKDVFIYEIGTKHYKRLDYDKDDDRYFKYYDPDEKLYNEINLLSGVLTGELVASMWQGKIEKVDFYHVKGIVDALIGVLDLGFEARYSRLSEEEYADFHPGQTARITVDGRVVGVVGKLHPNTKNEYDLNDTFAFELDLDALFDLDDRRLGYHPVPVNYQPISKYPGISFDIAITADEALLVSRLVDTIKKAGGKILKSVEVFDIYTGDGVKKGKKSVAINLYYQDVEKTLTETQVNPVHEKVLAMLEKEHGAVLRT